MFSIVKKIALSVSVIVLFALYSLQRRDLLPGQSQTTTALIIPTEKPAGPGAVQIDRVLTATTASGAPSVEETSQPTVIAEEQRSSHTFGKQSSSANAGQTDTPSPQVTSTPTGQYVDGTYTGRHADANWGNVQVEVVITNGQISSVNVLEFPDHRSRSRSINRDAVPELIQEALQAQSADVDIVSGATDTSEGFINSLGDALQGAAR
jgi:uncharacterized protein with FMN-binding domain